MWFDIFNPFAWFSKFVQPNEPEKDVQIDEEDLPEDFDELVEDDEESTE